MVAQYVSSPPSTLFADKHSMRNEPVINSGSVDVRQDTALVPLERQTAIASMSNACVCTRQGHYKMREGVPPMDIVSPKHPQAYKS